MSANFIQPDYTTMSGVTYPVAIDSSIAVLSGMAADFAPMASVVPDMVVRLAPGVIAAGGTMSVVGTKTSGALTAGSTAVPVASTVGVAPGMRVSQAAVYQAGTLTAGSAVVTGLSATAPLAVGDAVSGSGVPAGAVIASVDSASQVTMSAAATQSLPAVGLIFQGRAIPATATVTAIGVGSITLSVAPTASVASAALDILAGVTLVAPVGNVRTDIIALNRQTGAISVVQGTLGSAALPALSVGLDSIAAVTMPAGCTSITASMIADLRTAYGGLGQLATLNVAPVANGGTGATDATAALANLGITPRLSHLHVSAVPSIAPTASNNDALAMGAGSIASGARAIAMGKSLASGSDAFAAQITNNTSSYGALGSYSIAMGRQARAGNTDSVVIGNQGNASGNYGTVVGGSRGTVNQMYGTTVGGYNNAVNHTGGIAMGALSNTVADYGLSLNNGVYSPHGFDIFGKTTLTSDAVAKAILADWVPPFWGACAAFTAWVSGAAAAAWAGYRIDGVMRWSGGVAALIGTPTVTTLGETNSAWNVTVAVTAATGLSIYVTGAASTDISWQLTMMTTRAAY